MFLEKLDSLLAEGNSKIVPYLFLSRRFQQKRRTYINNDTYNKPHNPLKNQILFGCDTSDIHISFASYNVLSSFFYTFIIPYLALLFLSSVWCFHKKKRHGRASFLMLICSARWSRCSLSTSACYSNWTR